MRLALLAIVLLASSTTAAIPAAALAQQSEVDLATLTKLYDSLLQKGGQDTYLEKRIADERTRIRTAFDDEMNELVNARARVGTGETLDLQNALDRQRDLVTHLEGRLQEVTVDLDLLNEEERRYYTGAGTGTGAIEEIRLTTSHAELLARTSALEERRSSLTFFLSLQSARQRKLTWERWVGQFSSLIETASIAAAFVLAILAERIVRLRLVARIANRERRYRMTKIFTAGVYSLLATVLLVVLFSEFPGIMTSFAIVGAGIAVALQDVVKDIMGWILIVQGRRFSLGDRVTVGGITGDVIDISPLRTTLLEVGTTLGTDALEWTGKTLYLPNAFVLTQPLINYNTTSDFVKSEMLITVTYESSWRKAEEILLRVAREETKEHTDKARQQHRRRTQLFYFAQEPAEASVFVDLATSGVLFTIRFTIPIGKRRNVVSQITRRILEEFETQGIHLAYPTTRIIPTSPNHPYQGRG